MATTRFGTVLTLLLGCVLLVGALVFLRLRTEELRDLAPRHNPQLVGHICRQKAELMRMLRRGNSYAAIPQ